MLPANRSDFLEVCIRYYWNMKFEAMIKVLNGKV
jgi:hypothetical protein